MQKDYSKFFLPNTSLARKRLKDYAPNRKTITVDKKLQWLGKNLTFYIKTYGCQANVRDSETIKGIMTSLGFKESNDLLKTDIIILNTCAVRENAEKKVFGEIGFLKKLKKTNKNFKFGICGCMAQESEVVQKIVHDMPQIDFIFGTHNIYMLGNILWSVIKNNERVVHVLDKSENLWEGLPAQRNSKIKAYVNIMYGCDQFCTYCIVPYTRGQLRSRQQADIISEIKLLVKQGYQEVTLLGQNVNSYGKDFNNGYQFRDLLVDVVKTNISRIRFVTSNPWNFDYEIIDVIKKYPSIMPYFHLPIQSGNEIILKAMNRAMPIKKYIDLINYIRQQLPDSTISTDIIVGFPNESERQFLNTLKLYKEIKFDNAYTFIYSKRDGTPASKIIDKIPLSVKQKRLDTLNELVKKYAKWNNEKWVDRNTKVLVEGKSKTNDKVLTGYSPGWKVVNFIGTAKVGEIVSVKITSSSRFSLNGIQIRE